MSDQRSASGLPWGLMLLICGVAGIVSAAVWQAQTHFQSISTSLGAAFIILFIIGQIVALPQRIAERALNTAMNAAIAEYVSAGKSHGYDSAECLAASARCQELFKVKYPPPLWEENPS